MPNCSRQVMPSTAAAPHSGQGGSASPLTGCIQLLYHVPGCWVNIQLQGAGIIGGWPPGPLLGRTPNPRQRDPCTPLLGEGALGAPHALDRAAPWLASILGGTAGLWA